MKNDDWVKETNRRLRLVGAYFKPKEYSAILDFITTAGDVSKEEAKEKAAKKPAPRTQEE